MEKRTRKFEYKERTFDDMKERATKKNYNKRDNFIKEGFKFYKVKDGVNKLRIMPPTWEDAKHYGLDIYLHYGIGGGGDGFGTTYLCNAKMQGLECCIDKEVMEATSKGEKAYADSLKASRKVLMWVIDRVDEEEGPQLFPMPPNIDRELVSQSCDEDTGSVRFIDHPEKGFDISFVKEGKGKTGTKYSEYKVAWSSSPLNRNPDKVDQWMSFISDNPLPSVLQYYDDEHIREVFSGHVFKEETEESEVAEEEEYTYEEICEMNRGELEAFAVELGMKDSALDDKADSSLIDFIATKLNLDVPVNDVNEYERDEDKPEPESAQRSFREKLNRMKK